MFASVLAMMVLAASGIGLLRQRRYRAAFRIPARRDDLYRFRTPPRTFGISVGGQVEWPAGAYRRDSCVFLEIEVAATRAGHLLDPYIEVHAEGSSYRQYFERGARGTRYLNLSPTFQQSHAASGPVRLRGRHIRWSKRGLLLVFDPRTGGGGDALILAPHPDDSELAAFGLYCSRSSWVVTITAGERSPTDLSAIVPRCDEPDRWLARLRVWDSLTIPQLGGVPRERCLNLVFPDARLKQMHDNPGATFQLGGGASRSREILRAHNPLSQFQQGNPRLSWSDLVSDLQRTLDTARPAVLACPHPLIDPHYDHVYTSIALAEALRAAAHRPDLILLYAVHANEAPLYPFGGAESIVSLPPWSDADWIADSIYSHPLSEEIRRAKFFAVEAAHDLRSYADSRPRRIGQLAATVRREILSFLSGMPPLPTDFLRRAPRPNEIFFEVSVDGFLELAQRANRSAGQEHARAGHGTLLP